MKKIALLIAATFLTATAMSDETLSRADESAARAAWAPITLDARPWTRWWWMGSAVTPQDLTRELETFQKAGLGGVEVTPIYGAKGYEKQYIPFLSPRWMEMLAHTVSEARRLGMEVDMTTGTGWCMGGPNVGDRDANASVVAKAFDFRAGDPPLRINFSGAPSPALVAFSPDGKCVDFTKNIAADGTILFAPPGPAGVTWRVFQVSQKPSGQKVKRSAPGGEGWMLNLLYPEAMPRYLARFADAFSKSAGPLPRELFHDSYEYNSDWAPDFLAQFEKRRGYELQTELPALFENKGEPDHVARVKCDYRETVSELIEQSTREWTAWAHEHGMATRDQAHGSPGNWLDIYAAADIPETEFFYKDRDILVSKFASSAAHVTGRKLVGAETGTWVAEHFTETLADLKYLFDDMFLAGVNRITYHGTAYSPADAPWPGWCFYASAEMNPRNAIWRDVPALNAYCARCQAMLQSGRPDNDILLYWPVHDRWHDPKGMVDQFAVHGQHWFGEQRIGKAARRLWERGYSFDYISDEQLQTAKVQLGQIQLFGGSYGLIVVPACEHMPVETLRALLTLASNGATVIFEDHLPQDVPGFSDLEERREEFKTLLQNVKPADAGKTEEARLGAGRVRIGDIENSLDSTPVTREDMGDIEGVHFVRRSLDVGFCYFIANRGSEPVDRQVILSRLKRGEALVMDPMSGRIGKAPLTPAKEAGAVFRLQLMPGESIIVRTSSSTSPAAPWRYQEPAGTPVTLKGPWQVHFLEGGPQMPMDFEADALASWTELGGADAQSFAGTARYTLRFDAPDEKAEHWSLDLGKVCQSARVRLNGKDLGTVFIPPFRVDLPAGVLLPKDNVLEVDVTNTSANRIRDLDRRKVSWKNYYDVNFLNINYKPFDASNWPLTESGLLGPVTLVPIDALPSKR